MRHPARVLFVTLLAAAALAAGAPAGAQTDPSAPAEGRPDTAGASGAAVDGSRPSSGYVALSGYFLGLTDTRLRDVSVTSVENDIEADDGWGAGLALGLRGGMFRFEGEAAYRQNDLDRATGPVIGSIAPGGEVASLALMANLYLEPWYRIPIKPYVGAGLGGARVAFEARDLDADDSDWVLAYQGMVGVAFDLGPRVGLFGGYRYFATDDPAIAGSDIEYRTHNLEVGLRFGF